MRSYLALIPLFLLTSCAHERLSVYTEFISYENLASFHVGTPDPDLICPDYGQRITISWTVYRPTENTTLLAKIRFRNLEEVEWVVQIDQPRGHISYPLINQEYERTGGILSYKVYLMEGEEMIDETHHALWTELIVFERNDSDCK